MYQLGVLLLNHKSSRYIESLYKNVQETIGLPPSEWVFLIVDNSEVAAEKEYISSFVESKQNVLCRFISNKGYSQGNNYGINLLWEMGIRYCLLINPDIVFETNAVFPIFKQVMAHKPHCAIVGPRLVNGNNQVIPALNRLGAFSAVLDVPAFFGKETPSLNGESKMVYATTGCCLFIDIQKFIECGLFDERVFLYREEQILAERLKQFSFIWLQANDVVVKHNHSRKFNGFSTFYRHRVFECNSTLHYFKAYLKKSRISLLGYKMFFLVKSTIYASYIFSRLCLKK